MKINPKIGIDDIKLGMNQNQVKSILGQPSSIEKEKHEESWLYDHGIELMFQKVDLYLLGSITVTDPAAELDSKSIIGLGEQELLERFPYLALEDDFEENGKDYTSSEKELSVWVSEGIVSNVTVFPNYDETGEIPLWPSNNT